jgi:hypothetical protein|tara:strand:- start:79 stop:228 length:150 start_codon:yes stop_codon:yes gene_type:complete
MAKTFRIASLKDKTKSTKKTSIGRKNVKTSSMNKHKRRSKGKKRYRGQG